MIAAGAPIAMGTDKGTRLNFHESENHVRELEIFTELGMTPMDAIVSATLRAAELLGMEDELGTVEAGKLADAIVVDDNPLDDIWALRDVDLVFKEGCAVPVVRGPRAALECARQGVRSLRLASWFSADAQSRMNLQDRRLPRKRSSL